MISIHELMEFTRTIHTFFPEATFHSFNTSTQSIIFVDNKENLVAEIHLKGIRLWIRFDLLTKSNIEVLKQTSGRFDKIEAK